MRIQALHRQDQRSLHTREVRGSSQRKRNAARLRRSQDKRAGAPRVGDHGNPKAFLEAGDQKTSME